MAPHVLLIAVLLVTVAFGASRAYGTIGAKPVSPAPVPVLHWADEGVSDLLSLDPVRGFDFNAIVAAQLIYGGLVRFGPQFGILPDAADHWEVSADGRTYTFHLRSHVRFGDGRMLTTSDVVYSLNRQLQKRFAEQSNAYLLSDIQGAATVVAGSASTASGLQIVNATTLRIVLRQATGSFLAKLATPAGYIVPRWRIQANPKDWDEHAIGTGPFMVARWLHHDRLLLVPNPYYYGGALHIGGIDIPFIPEPLTAYKRYRAGIVDVMGTIHFPAQVLYAVRGMSDFHPSARLETLYLTLNLSQPPFNDPRIRRALAYAIDRKTLVRQVFGDFAQAAYGLLPPGILGFNPALQGVRYDPAQARRLLAQAGYPGGRALPTITYAVDQDAQALVLASALATQWRETLGVRVRLVQQNHTTYLHTLRSHQYQLAVIDWTADFADPQNFLSQLLHTGSPNNNGHWSNDIFDRLTDRADQLIADDPVRLTLYRQAEELAMHEGAVIPLVHPATGILLRPSIHGLQVEGGQVSADDWTKVTIDPGDES